MNNGPSKAPTGPMSDQGKQNFNDIFRKPKVIKSKKIKDGYGEKPYEEIVDTNKK